MLILKATVIAIAKGESDFMLQEIDGEDVIFYIDRPADLTSKDLVIFTMFKGSDLPLKEPCSPEFSLPCGYMNVLSGMGSIIRQILKEITEEKDINDKIPSMMAMSSERFGQYVISIVGHPSLVHFYPADLEGITLETSNANHELVDRISSIEPWEMIWLHNHRSLSSTLTVAVNSILMSMEVAGVQLTLYGYVQARPQHFPLNCDGKYLQSCSVVRFF
eukprot:TRINITY_DN45901_c1_g2_i1.p1 TRINITY_DN45901_c1_g2~~TRINITY_DN45901_c1_g2_i1.p1  ORF type:complete len:232 (-),score=38.93 TRINITY_DN45901_c1_g2_i1:70-726(-)